MPESGKESFVMRVPPEGAAMQFFTEAMRQNTEVLRQVNSTQHAMQAEVREVLKEVQDARERLIRLESSSLTDSIERIEEDMSQLQRDVEKLKESDITRQATASAAQWLLKHTPSIAAIIVCIVAMVILYLKATGAGV